MMRALLLIVAFFAFALSAADVDISGSWAFEVMTDAGSGNPTFTFTQKDGKLTGKYSGMLGEADVAGTVSGNKIEFSFKVSQGGESGVVAYQGTIESPTSMKGRVSLAGLGEGTFTGKKK